MPPTNEPRTPEEAVFAIYQRITSLETTIRGTPNTAEKGMVGEIQEVKTLAVQVKDYYIEQGKDVATLKARCKAFHGDSGSPGPAGERPNPLASVNRGRLISFLAIFATFVALVIYTLGVWVGWWPPVPPSN